MMKENNSEKTYSNRKHGLICLLTMSIPVIILLALSFLPCQKKLLVAEVDSFEIRECDCLLKGTTYRCSVINNAWDGLQYFFQIGKFKGIKPVYHFVQSDYNSINTELPRLR